MLTEPTRTQQPSAVPGAQSCPGHLTLPNALGQSWARSSHHGFTTLSGRGAAGGASGTKRWAAAPTVPTPGTRDAFLQAQTPRPPPHAAGHARPHLRASPEGRRGFGVWGSAESRLPPVGGAVTHRQ